MGTLSSRALTLGITLATIPALIASAGPDWVEQGDAGSSARRAQAPVRPPETTSLSTIQGSLGGDLRGVDFEDLYIIRIVKPGTFLIRPGQANFDASLYLFNLTVNFEALGILGNHDEDEDTNLPRLVQHSTDLSGVSINVPGDYILAVTSSGRFPVSSTGPIFSFADPTEISGPDGPGGLNPLAGWLGEGVGGSYRIDMEQVDFPRIPAPGGLAAAGVLGLVASRRRRS